MINLSPKSMFQSDEDRVKEFNNFAHSSTVQIALALSMTQFLQSNPSTEEIRGVNRFIPLLLNLGQKNDDPTPAAAYKSITQSLPRHMQEQQQPKK